ncbi:hypothetical protein NPIL_118961, partial [Nephila pilipes]
IRRKLVNCPSRIESPSVLRVSSGGHLERLTARKWMGFFPQYPVKEGKRLISSPPPPFSDRDGSRPRLCGRIIESSVYQTRAGRKKRREEEEAKVSYTINCQRILLVVTVCL